MACANGSRIRKLRQGRGWTQTSHQPRAQNANSRAAPSSDSRLAAGQLLQMFGVPGTMQRYL